MSQFVICLQLVNSFTGYRILDALKDIRSVDPFDFNRPTRVGCLSFTLVNRSEVIINKAKWKICIYRFNNLKTISQPLYQTNQSASVSNQSVTLCIKTTSRPL